jgi:hypothetical protein
VAAQREHRNGAPACSSEYEAYLAIILAAQYQCPSRIPAATGIMVKALNQLPATS